MSFSWVMCKIGTFRTPDFPGPGCGWDRHLQLQRANGGHELRQAGRRSVAIIGWGCPGEIVNHGTGDLTMKYHEKP